MTGSASTSRTTVTLASLGTLVFDVGHALAQGCAMCGTALLGDDPVTRAFTWSVLFLMAAPYTIVGAVGTWLYLNHRRSAVRHRAAVIDFARPSRAGGPAPNGERGGETP